MSIIARSIAVLVLLLGPTADSRSAQAPSAEDATVSVRDGVFTTAQADRGEAVFSASCKGCHQPEQFSGPGFIDAWTGQSADAPFDVIRTSMPEDNPSSLKRSEYAAVLAYLLHLNDLPTGETELPSLARKLKLIRIELAAEGRSTP